MVNESLWVVIAAESLGDENNVLAKAGLGQEMALVNAKAIKEVVQVANFLVAAVVFMV